MRNSLVYLSLIALFALGTLYGVAIAQTRINPDQLKAPRVAVFTCTKVPTPPVLNTDGTVAQLGSDCTGLYYVDVITPAGIELKILGTVQPTPVNAADFSLVP